MRQKWIEIGEVTKGEQTVTKGEQTVTKGEQIEKESSELNYEYLI